MTLFYETLAISALMALFCFAPRVLRSVGIYSQALLLVGTGALLGIYFFDLLPEVVEVGGRSSLMIVLAVWALYSVAHSFHLHHHQKEHCDHGETVPSVAPRVEFLMTSMVGHCVASGMFLALSHALSLPIERSVFWALVAHKGYEALSVSMVLQERVASRRKLVALTALYALSFPFGVAATAGALGFMSDARATSWLHTAAIVIASITAGSLMGCMVHDFVIPSLRQVRHRRWELGWVALGLAGTLAVLSQSH